MRTFGLAAAALIGGVGYRLVVGGELTLDTGLGRRIRPWTADVRHRGTSRDGLQCDRAPYLGRTHRTLAEETEVLERGSDMVLAAHRTSVVWGMVATTIETVRFERPEMVAFRLLRGPVPHVVERFTLHDDAGSTRLDYLGELGTDYWQLGRWWGDQVAREWEATVWGSLVRIRDEAERRTATGRRDRKGR